MNVGSSGAGHCSLDRLEMRGYGFSIEMGVKTFPRVPIPKWIGRTGVIKKKRRD
jgi:hypothetical protein